MDVCRMTLLLMVAVTLVAMSLGCYCGLRHPQQIFCESDFVVKVHVMEMEEVYDNSIPRHSFPLQVVYTVDIDKVYKQSDKFNNADHLHLLTGGSEGTCRQDLQVGHSYVIMGNVHDGSMHLHLCDWTSRVEDLTEHRIRGLRYKYRKGCNCEIKRCFGDQCNNLSNQNDTCPWRNVNECEVEYGFCTNRPDTGCSWRRNGMRRGCLESLNIA
ncbi:metalloproteinase inhibitor 3-like [Ylistrum balloti]|uniref:metalloproteinase inhibitor 3-like n=1 Tax=Ylistrum balloti TaxID=509963 RepID=UPI002905849C|nr:metalloproteinase inhibitor 3-like [Ylistrum balloti]